MTGGTTDAKRKAALESARERQRRFKEKKWAKGLTRITVWVPKEDAEELKLSLGEPGAFERLREDAMAGLQAEYRERLDKWVGGRVDETIPTRLRDALAAAAGCEGRDGCLHGRPEAGGGGGRARRWGRIGRGGREMSETKRNEAVATGDDGLERFLVALPSDASPQQRTEAFQETLKRFVAEFADAPEPEMVEDRWTTHR